MKKAIILIALALTLFSYLNSAVGHLIDSAHPVHQAELISE